MSHYPDGCEPSNEMITGVVARTIEALDRADIPHLLIGGAGTQTFARPRCTDDIDVFVEPGDAKRALETLAGAGYTTEETDPAWLYKAWFDGVLVDVIFRSSGDLYLDDEMLQRGERRDYRGTSVLLMCPEDLLVVKAMAATEDNPRHWYDALALVARRELDWDYVARRARVGPRRVLSLLFYAESIDLAVPPGVLARLYEMTHPTVQLNAVRPPGLGQSHAIS
jgi:predicted nucleotidyltransferase